MIAQRRRDVVNAFAIGIVMFVAYNANGREIASGDSQPTKLAARELLLRGSLALNFVVGRTPQLLERPGFVLARDRRYRSAYSPVPAIAAAALTWPLWKAGIVDVRAPLAPAFMAALTASLFTAISVVLAYLTARRWLPPGRAAVVAAALGLGTGLWSTVSQTLWQHETAILGVSVAVLAFTRPREQLTLASAAMIGVGLGIAATGRLQLAPVVLAFLTGLWVRGGLRACLTATAATAVLVVPLIVMNIRWFGTPLGAAAMLETLHETLHRTTGTFALWSDGYAGLLVSPNRGLLVFSPAVGVAVFAIGRPWPIAWRSPLLWCTFAAAAQFGLYGAYVVWWGGHTYGPRYMLDVLPLIVPLAAAGLARVRRRAILALAAIALAWSVLVAATGAFFYPNDAWNTDPASVDRFHERTWDWSDMQIVRCWRRGPSPQNFSLFTRDAYRVPPQP